MAFIEIIESFDKSNDEIVSRYPLSGSAETKLGAQLIVREYQNAVFFRDGRALDTFGPGRHTLTTLNLPLLGKYIEKPFGGESPFKVEIYYVNVRVFPNLKWGTNQPIAFRDSELSMVRLKSHGIFSLRVIDPLLFINQLVGSQGIYTTGAVENFLKGIIISRLHDTLGELVKTVLDLPQYYDELGNATKARLSDDFKKYGIEAVDFYINAISVPEEVEKLIDERSGMGAIGNMNQYLTFKTAKAMEAAATQGGGEGNTAGAGMSMGAGLGMGMMIPGMIAQAMNQNAQTGTAGTTTGAATVPCSKCNQQNPTSAKFCNSCGEKLPEAAKGKFCSQCGKPVPVDAKFCQECGHKV